MARKPVRSPFVVTVAVITGAALAGCGGQVAPGSSTTSTTDSGTSTNPPPVPGTTCPTSQPAVGTACNVESTVFCDYPTGGCGSTGYQCQKGAWAAVGGSSCNPPPVCPLVPYEGAPCTPGFGACTYPDKCPERPSTEPADRIWYCSGTLHAPETTTDYVVMCPAVQPVSGAPCPCVGHYAGSCSYGDCGGVPTIDARCDEKTQRWVVIESSCNPPFDAGSP